MVDHRHSDHLNHLDDDQPPALGWASSDDEDDENNNELVDDSPASSDDEDDEDNLLSLFVAFLQASILNDEAKAGKCRKDAGEVSSMCRSQSAGQQSPPRQLHRSAVHRVSWIVFATLWCIVAGLVCDGGIKHYKGMPVAIEVLGCDGRSCETLDRSGWWHPVSFGPHVAKEPLGIHGAGAEDPEGQKVGHGRRESREGLSVTGLRPGVAWSQLRLRKHDADQTTAKGPSRTTTTAAELYYLRHTRSAAAPAYGCHGGSASSPGSASRPLQPSLISFLPSWCQLLLDIGFRLSQLAMSGALFIACPGWRHVSLAAAVCWWTFCGEVPLPRYYLPATPPLPPYYLPTTTSTDKPGRGANLDRDWDCSFDDTCDRHGNVLLLFWELVPTSRCGCCVRGPGSWMARILGEMLHGIGLPGDNGLGRANAQDLEVAAFARQCVCAPRIPT